MWIARLLEWGRFVGELVSAKRCGATDVRRKVVRRREDLGRSVEQTVMERAASGEEVVIGYLAQI